MIPDLDHLRRAYAETSRATQVTPLLEARPLADLTGAARVFVKPESLQWAGSFKVRGAYWRLKQLSPEEAERGVVAYSSGNFAQGLAAAGQALGIPVTIVMPIDAPKAKSDATRGYGARVVQTEHDSRAREEVALERAKAISEEEGLTLLHPFDDPEVVYRAPERYHAGLIVKSDRHERVSELVDTYSQRFMEEFFATLPIGDKPSH